MTGALGSGSTTRPPLSQPWARALPLLLGSGPSPFEATRQPSKGRPETEDLRSNPLTGKPEPELKCDHCGKTGTMFGDAPEDFDICQKCYDELTVCVTIRWHKHPLTRHWMEGFQCDACLDAQHVHTRRPRSGRACRLRLEAPWHLGHGAPPARARAGLGPEQG